MANRNTPILGYLQSAVADNTAHGSIDRLLLENEMNNQPSHSRVQLMGEQGNPDNPQRWIRKNYNEDGSIASTSFVGKPQQKNKAQAHRNLLMEALSQPPQYTMGVPDEPFEPLIMPEDLIPIGGAMRLLKKAKDYPKMIKALRKVADREKQKYEVMEDAARKFGPKLDAGGADKAGKEYLTTKWIQKILEQNPF